MKQFRVTVNGQLFEVSVEEIAGDAAAEPVKAAKATLPSTDAALLSPAAIPQQLPDIKKISSVGTTVNAPMPGVVLSVSVNPGSQVKAGEILLILEAMKMENEITAPADGTVLDVCVRKGASVNSGDIMVLIG